MKSGDRAERIQHLQQRAEAALRESEERFRLVSQSISDYAFSFIIDEHGDLSTDWLTDRFTDVTGYQVKELLGRMNPLCTHIHPDDLETVLRTVRTLQPGVRTTYQFRVVTKDGDTRWVQSHPQAVADVSGRVIRFYGAARDITKEYETAQALRESEARYRVLFENANDAIATFALDGVITNVNHTATYLLGWSREELIGQHFSTFAPPASVALAEERTRRFLAGEKLPSATFEVELVRKDGSLLQDERARARFVIVTTTSSVSRAATVILAPVSGWSTSCARSMLNWNDGCRSAPRSWSTPTRRYTLRSPNTSATRRRYVNAKPCSTRSFRTRKRSCTCWTPTVATSMLTGSSKRWSSCSNEAVRGKSVYDLFPPAVAAALDVNTRAVLASGTPLETEVTLPHADGQPHVYHSLKAPLRDAGGALRGLVGVATDITVRKRLEEALLQREREFATLVENLPDIVFRLNRELRHLFINRAVEQVSGLPPEHLLGKTGRELGIPVAAILILESLIFQGVTQGSEV